MSDALEKARENILGVDLSDMSRAREGLIDALTSEFGPAYIVEHIELFVTAVINTRNPVAIIECEDCNARVLDFNAPHAILDAREAKAEPDPRDARIAELERERDEAIEHARQWQDRKQVWKGYAEKAEAALAELRGRVEKARTLLASEYGPGRNFEALALLTDPEAKEGGGPDSRRDSAEREHIAQPAQDTDPVPATDAREAAIQALVDALETIRSGDWVWYRGRRAFGEHSRCAAKALASARAAGITGKGTSDE